MATANADSPDTETEMVNTDVVIPEDITSSTAKLVYLYVHSVGQTTVDEIRSALSMKKLTLFGVLPLLISRGYVARDGDSVFSQDN